MLCQLMQCCIFEGGYICCPFETKEMFLLVNHKESVHQNQMSVMQQALVCCTAQGGCICPRVAALLGTKLTLADFCCFVFFLVDAKNTPISLEVSLLFYCPAL